MVTILGRASENDPASLKLYTTLNKTFIPNERPDTELTPDTLRAARAIVLQIAPTAVCRSLTGMYNCVGLVFANRRTMVDAEHLPKILADDGYHHIAENEAFVGDVVIYKRNRIAQHVAIVYEFRDMSLQHDGSIKEMFVLSQWGQHGEYLHKVREVHPLYGTDLEFWTERRQI